MIYPIAEIFHSVQGEGFWTGTPMMFVRLAGCNVGKYVYPNSSTFESHGDDFKLLDSGKHSLCTTFDGQSFICDTDYHTSERLTVEQIASQLKGEKHVCITGGEPFMYDLAPLCRALSNVTIHVETSGTKDSTGDVDWITCCPKAGQLSSDIFDMADEWKVLVGPNFDEEAFKKLDDQLFTKHKYLQPINGVNSIWQTNLQKCLELLTKYPDWKLSAQLHKFINVR